MEKKQATLFSFFKAGATPSVSTAESKENHSRNTTAPSSPRNMSDASLMQKSVDMEKGLKLKSTLLSKKRKGDAASSSSGPSSDSSSDSSSYSSDESSLSDHDEVARTKSRQASGRDLANLMRLRRKMPPTPL